MPKIIMCPYCNGKHIEEFEKLLKEKNVELYQDCIGKCEKTTPVCLLDDVIVEAIQFLN